MKKTYTEEVSVGEYIRDAYSIFGTAVNTGRALPQMSDGCKPVVRRVLYSSFLLGNKFVKSATLTGKTIGEYHPHSPDSVYGTVVTLVNSGLLEGQGQFGSKAMLPDGDTTAAASRYTEVKLKDTFFDLIGKLVNYVPYEDSELEGYKIPKYIPTPLPISLISGTFGVGFGINTDLPAFTPKSLLSAYLSDDPKKLRLQHNVLVDYKLSDFKKLWYEGTGNIIASFKVEMNYSLDKTTWGTVITGDPSLFRVKFDKDMEEMISTGRVTVSDESGSDGPRLFVARSKRVSVISDEWVYDKCKMASINSLNYRIHIANGDQAGRIGIRDWIHSTYTNYISLLETYIQDFISKTEWKLQVLQYADYVMDEFQKSKLTATNEELADKIGIDTELVADIMKSSLSTWRRMDKDARRVKLESELSLWKSKNPKSMIVDLVNAL